MSLVASRMMFPFVTVARLEGVVSVGRVPIIPWHSHGKVLAHLKALFPW